MLRQVDRRGHSNTSKRRLEIPRHAPSLPLNSSTARADARERLKEEIERLIMNAARCGSVVRTGYFAGMLAKTYAEAGFSVGHIVDAIADAASRRGIPVEIAPPDDADRKDFNVSSMPAPSPRFPETARCKPHGGALLRN
jgi:hypothetical protein